MPMTHTHIVTITQKTRPNVLSDSHSRSPLSKQPSRAVMMLLQVSLIIFVYSSRETIPRTYYAARFARVQNFEHTHTHTFLR